MYGRQFGLILLLVSSLLGCSGGNQISSYNATKDRMTYKTRPLTVAQGVSESSGYATRSQTRIILRARAQCTGRNCTPDTVRLLFKAEGTGSTLAISNRVVSIEADGKTYEWGQNASWNETPSAGNVGPSGRIVETTLPISTFAQIANAQSLKGTLGGKTLTLTNIQPHLQSFVRAARRPSRPK